MGRTGYLRVGEVEKRRGGEWAMERWSESRKYTKRQPTISKTINNIAI